MIEQSASELRRRIAGKDLSPLELLDAYIAQIERTNPKINAFTVTCFDEARAAAKAVEARIMAGEEVGLLAGLPLAIKDMSLTKGMRTTFGSLIYENHVPDRDDLVVQFLREEGAIICGKTNTTEFGAGNNTTNFVFGPTVNPFDHARTSGGSSGGAAAALATNMVPIATGSDTGGSLRVPATFCGVMSLKPTPGLIPFERRIYPFWPFQLQGAMGRTIEDVGLLTAAMARDHSIDPMTSQGDPRDRNAGFGPRRFAGGCSACWPDFLNLETADLNSIRVAFSPDLGFAPTSKMIRRVFDDRVARIRDMFGRAEIAQPDLSMAARVNWVIRGLQYLGSQKDHYAKHKDKLSPNVRVNYEQALAITTEDIAWAFQEHGNLHREMDRFFGDYDVLVCPGATVSPFPKEDHYVAVIDCEEQATYVAWAGLIPTSADNDSQRRLGKVFGKERAAKRCGVSGGVRDAVRKPCQAALRVAYAARRRASERLDDVPHRRRRPSYPTRRLRDLYGSLSTLVGITNALSTTGNPVVCLPCGKDEEGMPFGFQIVGPRRSDAAMLRIAKALEAAFASAPDLSRPVASLAGG